MSKVGIEVQSENTDGFHSVEMQATADTYIGTRRRGIKPVKGKDVLILEELGINAFSRSYKCYCETLQEETVYILKSINMSQKHLRKHAMMERALLQTIQMKKGHNNILRQCGVNEEPLPKHMEHDQVRSGGIACNMVLEYMDKGNLYYAVETAKRAQLEYPIDDTKVNMVFNEHVIASIALQLLSALQFLQKYRIVHRDIKPDNVLLNSYGEVKLINFGSGLQLHANQMFIEGLKGTPAYWSPEVAQGRSYTYSIDTWALGLTLLYCITGEEKFKSKDNREDICVRIVNDQAPSLSEDMNKSLRHFLSLCLQKDHLKRPSVDELLKHEFITTYTAESNILKWPKVLNIGNKNSLSVATKSTHLTLKKQLEALQTDQNISDVIPNIETYKDVNLNSYLHAAVKLQRKDQVLDALEKKIDINGNDVNGETPMFLAAKTNNPEILQLLLQHGANVNELNDADSSAVLMATIYGFTDIVSTLIEHNIDVNRSDTNGQAPQQVASELGYFDIAELLVQNKAEVLHTNHEHITALLTASHAGHDSIVELLLKHKAYINHKDANQMSALLYAAKKRNYHTVQILVENNANINLLGDNGYSALLYVSQHINMDTATLLLQNKADVNVQCTEYGFTPLMYAASKGNVAYAELLHEYKAMHDQKDLEKLTALQWAAKNGQVEMIKFLISINADVSCKNIDGYSALLIAAMNGNNLVIETLLDLEKQALVEEIIKSKSLLASKKQTVSTLKTVKVVDINELSLDNYTSLILATKEKYVDTVALLVERKADIIRQDRCKRSALMWAATNNMMDTAKLLINTYKYEDNEERDEDEVQELINLTNDEGFSALQLAAEQGYAEMVELLLQNKANLRHYDDSRYQTAWDLAKGNNHTQVLAVLNQAYKDESCCTIM